jgi:hypothetical protein
VSTIKHEASRKFRDAFTGSLSLLTLLAMLQRREAYFPAKKGSRMSKSSVPIAEKIATGTAEPSDLAMAAGPNLQLITSLAFGSPDLRTAYLGSLVMGTLPTFQSPVAGLPMRHWK